MRTVLCGTSLLLVTMTLVGCGQTGPLILPNDPNNNRKAQYLLYKEEPKVQKATEKSVEQPAETQSVTPIVSETK